LTKPGVSLIKISEELEKEAEKLKVKWAFPVDFSINEMAAHVTTLHDDKAVAEGLLKIDLGVCVDGYIADMAKTIDLTPDKKYSALISASSDALNEAIKKIKYGVEIREIGKTIHDTIIKKGFSPIRNLSGHELKRNILHAGITIPNYDNNNTAKLEEGIYAVEPFATTGEGIVQDSKPSGSYMLKQIKPVRDAKTRQILQFIEKEYSTLPFSSRWIIKKFGLYSLMALKILEQNEIIHQFSQLVEKSRMPVSQSEHTILVEKNKVSVLTLLQ